MRLVGKGSAASALRWVLGFVNVCVVLGIVALAIISIMAWAEPSFVSGLTDGLNGAPATGPDPLTVKRFYYLGGMLSLAFVWLIINRLRRIFLAVNQGDAFEAANVKRLQMVGVGLIGLELASYFTSFAAPLLDGDSAPHLRLDLKMWVAILVVFILAEVFRQGSRMRHEAQMTV